MSLQFEALFQRAIKCHGAGDLEQAESMYRFLLLHTPHHPGLMHLLGLILNQRGQTLEAITLLDQALALKPDFAQALNDRGVMAESLGKHDEALVFYKRALQSRPEYADAHNNRGVVLKMLGRLAEALEAYERALAIQPDLADAHNNRGVVLQDLQRFEEALACYETAIGLAPDYAEAHWNMARHALLHGDYAVGWREYEWRWKRPAFAKQYRSFEAPRWTGMESLAGKTILLHAEQGLGDTIQFARYAKAVADKGAQVILEVQPRLKALLSNVAGVTGLFARGEALPAFDFQCPLMSLPLAFGTTVGTIPREPTHITVDPDKARHWDMTLGPKQGLRIGLAWSGNANQQDNDRRSIALSGLSELVSGQAQFVSMQREVSAEERALLSAAGIVHFDEAHSDFSDSAAFMANMDIVISVCTSVAHLAGSMGKPLWVLLHDAHDWRWLRERKDSPWYPQARLYRQIKPGDWQPVLTQLSGDLQRAVASAPTLLT